MEVILKTCSNCKGKPDEEEIIKCFDCGNFVCTECSNSIACYDIYDEEGEEFDDECEPTKQKFPKWSCGICVKLKKTNDIKLKKEIEKQFKELKLLLKKENVIVTYKIRRIIINLLNLI